MTALTDESAVVTALGRDLTDAEADRVAGLIDAASARFRRAAGGRQITAGVTTAVLRVSDGRVRLPQRPVVSIDEVRALNADGTPGGVLSTWVYDGVSVLRIGDPWIQQLNAPHREAAVGSVRVTWTHGHATVPDDVRHAVAAMTARALSAPAAAGVQSETIGGYTYRLGEAATSGLLGMTPDEVAVAVAYGGPRHRSMGLAR